MKIYDVIIIGGGAAGLIAAGRAAELGASVLVLEKNKQVGNKLLMTGGGRCNFTNHSAPRLIAGAFGKNGRWLLSGLSRFGSEETIKFFQEHGVKIKKEDNGRVFPEKDSATEILNALTRYLKQGEGEIQTSATVKQIQTKDNRISRLILENGDSIIGRNYIIATGGQSYPGTGSSGDAYTWLTKLSHKIIDPRPAISRIIVKDQVKDLGGLSLTNITLYLYQGTKKISIETGALLFTNHGLSGPAALNLSRSITRHLNLNNQSALNSKANQLKIKIDFWPEEDKDNLNQRFKLLSEQNKHVSLKNILAKLFQKRLADYALTVTKVKSNQTGDSLTRSDRQALVDFFKGYSLSVQAIGGFNEAMITVGGVDLREINPQTMASKLIGNLYLAGEVLDLDGPTGGYNLQASWTTGYLAGENAAQ